MHDRDDVRLIGELERGTGKFFFEIVTMINTLYTRYIYTLYASLFHFTRHMIDTSTRSHAEDYNRDYSLNISTNCSWIN
jgi:hypothetical protein